MDAQILREDLRRWGREIISREKAAKKASNALEIEQIVYDRKHKALEIAQRELIEAYERSQEIYEKLKSMS